MQSNDAALQEEKQQLLAEMDELLYREELMWMQQSRVAWLREGDRNTKYFHRKATWRQRKNKISKLKRVDGTWTENNEEMGDLATDFFRSCTPGMTMLIQLSCLSCSRLDWTMT